MDIWKYYDGDLKYLNLDKHSTSEIEIAKTNPKRLLFRWQINLQI